MTTTTPKKPTDLLRFRAVALYDCSRHFEFEAPRGADADALMDAAMAAAPGPRLCHHCSGRQLEVGDLTDVIDIEALDP